MKNIVIFGAPGSGKGTQSDLLVQKYGFKHISTGDVLRAEIKQGTELGQTAQSYIDKGQLIPDSLMIDILAQKYDALCPCEGVIFDGFPRTITQAEALKQMLETLRQQGPKDIRIASLLVKPGNLKVDLDIDYCCFKIPNDFIVGYGLDYDGEGRNLRNIYTVVEE